MDVLILYCVFSYLMIGTYCFLVERDALARVVVFIMSPLSLPVIAGALLKEWAGDQQMKDESTAYCKKMINASYESAREAQEEDNITGMNYYLSEAQNYESRLAELML